MYLFEENITTDNTGSVVGARGLPLQLAISEHEIAASDLRRGGMDRAADVQLRPPHSHPGFSLAESTECLGGWMVSGTSGTTAVKALSTARFSRM